MDDFPTRDYLIPRKQQRLAILRLEYPISKDDIVRLHKWIDLLDASTDESNEKGNVK